MCYRHHGFPYTYHDFECVRPDHQHPNSAMGEAQTYTPNSACALGYIIFGSIMCVNFEISVNELQFSSPKEKPYLNLK